MKKKDIETKNSFDFLKSKVRELHIPLPNFKFFHKPSSEEDVFENFVGHEDDAEKLEELLINDDTGAYLVAGYRGTGKTSLVGKVLNKITRQQKNIKIRLFNLFCLLLIFSFISCFYILLNSQNFQLKLFQYKLGFPIENDDLFVSFSFMFFLALLGFLAMFVEDKNCVRNRWNKCKRRREKIDEPNYKNHKTWFDKVFKIKEDKGSKHNIVIKINLGHESLNEKDILSLITKRIYDTYKKHRETFYTNWMKLIFKTTFLSSISIFSVFFLDEINITSYLNNPIENNSTIVNSSALLSNTNASNGELHNSRLISNSSNELNNSGVISNSNSTLNNSSNLYITFYNFVTSGLISQKQIFNNDYFSFVQPVLITKIILVIFFYFLSGKLWIFFVIRIPFLRKYSRRTILKDLRFLIDRIEASVTVGSGSGFSNSSSIFSMNFLRNKNKAYPIASAREIEDELIQILHNIHTRFITYKWFQSPKFIIIFDELDKIDPVYNQITKTEKTIPEFETSFSFEGGSATRDRKQNVLKLLGNMKLFMSQAKAKFVFIAGRELYDAFLADLADREFATSSIFNGVTYVNSFLESSAKQKNILTKTEEYICGYLIPEKWYREEAKKQYHKKEKIENIVRNLRTYKKFLIKTLITDYLKSKKIKKLQLGFESFIEFKSLNKGNALLTEKVLIEIEQKFLSIDKVIVFLNQFFIYLTHICNGSPKKISIYFEKYIKMYIDGHPKNFFKDCHHKAIKESKFCLTFTAIDQQNIGFIYYLTYPIVQAIINNSSNFGDKMLVSTSFLIDHIFKHHKGGFSHDHIEHTPELLEIYHIPHLRTMIDMILSFLRENYVTDICGGVYQYKFRKFIADEILYNSRISEEISAIFNFTLDESLPVKRYYYKQIVENEKKYLALEERIHTTSTEPTSPIKNPFASTLVSQLEILGEIHLWDEEYNEAIQHLKSAFEVIKAELKRTSTDKNKLHLYVLLNRTALKLGLAVECKGYYDEAFVIYNTLIDYLTEFRDVKETALGLNYFYEYNNLVNDTTGEWKAKKTKIYHNVDGKILRDQYYYEDRHSFYVDNFYDKGVFPFIREMDVIRNEKIDFLFDSDYMVPALSKILSFEKQEIISRLTLFSEIKSIFQVILANLFIVEKIDHNGITQENIDLAEDQFKFIYLLTDSKDKFIQAADFYKKLASILFLKNYYSTKAYEYIQMWGFNIYETINEFCFIKAAENGTYRRMIDDKFPKEILKDFFVDRPENLWTLLGENCIDLDKKIEEIFNSIDEQEKINELITNFCSFSKDKLRKHFKESELEKCCKCYNDCTNREKNHPCYACAYVSKSLDIFKRAFIFKYKEQLDRERNERLNKKISELLEIVDKEPKEQLNKKLPELLNLLNKETKKLLANELLTLENLFNQALIGKKLKEKINIILSKIKELSASKSTEEAYNKRITYFIRFLEYFRKTEANCNNNYLFVLASSLRIKADITLSCVNVKEIEIDGKKFIDNKLEFSFLNDFFSFLTEYYHKPIISDDFIDKIENEELTLSKLEKTILYYWLSAEYFHLSASDVDANECLSKILIIFDKYLDVNKQLHLWDNSVQLDNPFNSENLYKTGDEKNLFEKIQDTIVRRILKNSRTTADNVNYIELSSLKFIMMNRAAMEINLSYLSTTASIEEILFSYCKFELNSRNFEEDIKLKGKDIPDYLDCYKSTLLSPNRFSSTIQEKIHTFVFKERMNMAIFENIFKKKAPLNFYDTDFQIKYFEFLKYYFKDTYDIKGDLEAIGNFENDSDTKMKFLHFLISDSLFCLIQIVETLSSGGFYNFSHSFIGDIYHQISKWATLYKYTDAILPKYNTNHKGDIDNFLKKEINTMKNRMITFGKIFDSTAESKFKDIVREISNLLMNKKINKEIEITDRDFETEILNDIGTGNRHFLNPTYSVAMTLKYYHKAIRINSEGKEYKEMIKKMYIIDDDITNGMQNFSLALERYTMNCGIIEKKMDMLRKYYSESLCHQFKRYLKDTSMEDVT